MTDHNLRDTYFQYTFDNLVNPACCLARTIFPGESKKILDYSAVLRGTADHNNSEKSIRSLARRASWLRLSIKV